MASRSFSAPGFIEADEDERTIFVKQADILKDATLLTKSKFFNLQLDQFGPYKHRYNQNGKRLLLGGARGHLASFDWLTKNLLFEVHVQDRIRDVVWLHDETMLAVAQKKKVFVYDINGIELHRIKYLHEALRLEFLPHHFLLVAARKKGFLSYFDTSTGTLISNLKTHLGRPADMCQNPQSGVIVLGHSNGTATLWCPNQDKAAAKIMCHSAPISSLSIDFSGSYMATADSASVVKIWDLRTYRPVSQFRVFKPASTLCFSQTGLLALSLGDRVDVYRDVFESPEKYIRQTVYNSTISDTHFCPFEDVLGVSHEQGFMNMLVPGAGEANIDSLNPNPFQTKGQRREYGVKKLLEKIQPEMITLDTSILAAVGEPLKTPAEIGQELLFKRLMPSKPRSKRKSAMSTGRALKQVQDQVHREKRRIKLIEKLKSKNNY